MRVLFIAPHFPVDMPYFTRALAVVGAEVWGAGSSPYAQLPEFVRHHLHGYFHVPNLLSEAEAATDLVRRMGGGHFDRVETHWEPTVGLAARVRQHVGAPGLDVDGALAFRDKAVMKARLAAAGVRVPENRRATTTTEVREAVRALPFPLIIKPIDGAGAQNTHRVESHEEVEAVLPALRHVPEVSVEEYIEGEEYTYDAVCIDGAPAFESCGHYRPKPIESRNNEWISPAQIVLRDPESHGLGPGLALGRQVLRALGAPTGFTHMEWFLTPTGECIFGEIGARAPGGKLIEQMNYANDFDIYRGWAEAVCWSRFSEEAHRRYHVATVFKRAHGQGSICHIEGLDRVRAHVGEHLVSVDLLPLGHPRRDWRATLLSDGSITVRHPDYERTLDLIGPIITDLRLHAR